MRRFSFLMAILSLYLFCFFQQEAFFDKRPLILSFPLPAWSQKISLGYLKQLGAEILFVKTSVFLGGLEPGRDPEDYASSLAENFETASALHPAFIDTYFFCQSSLSYIGPERTKQANSILLNGIKALPDNWILPFFIGFNYFHLLNEPKEAAYFLNQAAERPLGPQMLKSLAAILAAEGGDIYAGLTWLKAMHAMEKDELVRERYEKRIMVFEKAAVVLQATHAYREKYHQSPPTLDDLVPEFLTNLPQITEDKFVLSWDPPILRLVRPKH